MNRCFLPNFQLERSLLASVASARTGTVLLALPAVVAALPLHAQTAPGIEEIVVTADFRQDKLDNIPASISVLDAKLIRQKNALHLEDVLADAPNVNFDAGASRARYFQLRGIGDTEQFVEPLNASVGMLIDGVDFTGLGAAAMLYDIEQVEILQGPQGTRYGSNALAGLINLQSKAPTDSWTYGLQLQGENYNGRGFAGYAGGPLGDGVGFRVAAQRVQSDGFGFNTYLHRPTNDRDEQTLRATLQWQASPTLQFTVHGGVIDADNGYDAFSLDNSRNTLSDQPGRDTQLSRFVSAQLQSTAFDAFTLELLATYAKSHVHYGYDEDWVYAGFDPNGYESTDLYLRDHLSRSGELRLLSTPQGALFNGRTSWIAGLYTLTQDVDLHRIYTYLPSDFFSNHTMRRHAAYADTTTTLTERWSFDAGLRAERYTADYSDSDAVRFSPGETLWGGKLALNYRTDGHQLLYASVSRGYKNGGFNTDGTLDADLRQYGSESLVNYEMGFKGSLLDGRAHLRTALFYMDRKDVQISSSTVRLRSDGSSEFIIYTGNAAAGYNRGAEFSGDFAASDSVRLYGSLGLLDTAYKNFINSAGDNLDGRAQAQAPRYQYTLGTTWQLPSSLSFDINVQGRGAYYYSDSHDQRSNPYDLLNSSLTWREHQWQVTLWGRNLTNIDYPVRGYYFGNDPRDDYANHLYTQLGEPRRFGVTVNLDF
ncbi:MAG TPA: TonB-dependent receptor [Candidatus Acidoferrum sp.]|nr:TonB-dependent receptor [Candidatus Acidoferrum sp.]